MLFPRLAWLAPLTLLTSLALGCPQVPLPPLDYDVLLQNGLVVDGTGAPPARADIGIRGDRIAAIGQLAGATATTVLDASGLVIAPGFLDVHAHVDSEIARHPGADNFLRMGVTTIVTGNCGRSVPDLAAHLARVERGGVGVNYGSLCGHGTVREAVLGTENRDPTPDELQRMEQLVDTAMQAGAFGLSTGLIYVPGTYAKTEELIALARVAARHGGLYASHTRNEGDQQPAALDEILRIGREAAIPVHVSHIKCTGRPNHGNSKAVLDRLLQARQAGQAVTSDQYAYTASSTGLDVLFPSDELAVGRESFAQRLRDDQEFRTRMHRALRAKMQQVGFGDFGYCQIANAKGNEALNGLRFPEAAQRRYGKGDADAQAELAIDLFVAAAPTRVSMIYHTMDEADVAAFLAVDWIAVAADAGVLNTDGAGKPHPRGSGNNVRVLGHYVRERQVLSLPLAIHKMTALPARIFGIVGRGTLAVGGFADCVVFDPATVQDRATFDEPMLPPGGIAWVLVNGRIAVDHDKVSPTRAGAVLRRQTTNSEDNKR